ncbi:hypothetical protein ACIBAI_01965 [Streptomyces sp. NPDC051041]|uniref:hypothetical protein n=1 Tax=Streptomyces sp. NPDC051041 TaxID=3365640 RepID=UPI0037A1DE45
MRALPARRIASSALCAALLVGITGPAAMAADSAREHGRAASAGTRLPGADARPAVAAELDRSGLAPVADLLTAVLEEDGGRLSPREAEELGAAARAALADAVAKARARSAAPTASAPATGALPPALARPEESERRAIAPDDELEDVLKAVQEALEGLLDAATAEDVTDTDDTDDTDDAADTDTDIDTDTDDTGTDDVDEVISSVDDLLTELDDLLEALDGADLSELLLPEPEESPSASAPTSVPLLPAVTLPALPAATPLPAVLLPAP